MARIRSVHPGFFTDENCVSVSAFARLLFIGIWTEADDYGAFEWKPVTLKMRILPVDNVDVPELMEELEAYDLVRSYEHKGRKYGVVRNFAKYQRPKKPTAKHFIPAQFRTYVGLDDESSELTPPLSAPSSEPKAVKRTPVPKKSEIAPQMEDGGGEGGVEKEEESSSPPVSVSASEPDGGGGEWVTDPVARKICDILNVDPTTHAGWAMVDGSVDRWRRSGFEDEDIIGGARLVAASRKDEGPPGSPKYLDQPIQRAKRDRTAPMPEPSSRRSDAAPGIPAKTQPWQSIRLALTREGSPESLQRRGRLIAAFETGGHDAANELAMQFQQPETV